MNLLNVSLKEKLALLEKDLAKELTAKILKKLEAKQTFNYFERFLKDLLSSGFSYVT